MVEALTSWWNEIEQALSRAPLHFQQDLHIIVKHCRDHPGGEIACCGSFLPLFVTGLPNKDFPITGKEKKTIMRILKMIGNGCRRLLRLAAEVQRGPLGINLRQHTIFDFYKPINLVTSKKKKDRSFPEIKNRNVTELYKNIKPYDIFDTTPSLTYNNVFILGI